MSNPYLHNRCIECDEEAPNRHPDFLLCDECFELFRDEPGRVAAAIHLDLCPSDLEESSYKPGWTFDGNFVSYWVLEDGDQYDQAFKTAAESWIDDMQIPDHLRPYFDEELWIEEARSESYQIMGASDQDEVSIYDENGDHRTFYILNT